ncbi:MAG: response regulator [Elusimicrobia bacterium]|nr:response regulator [Elusimicrobiota bacterium]
MSAKLDVLVLEDSQDDTRLLIRKLSKDGGYLTVHERVDTLAGLRAALNKREWDIIISDHSMPRFSALQALQELKDRRLDIPVIILSGTIESSDAVTAMKAGASDFIMKDDTTRLLPAIERELREARSRRERRLAQEQFQQAQKMESIGKLAGGVAHDFNNILTAIIGYTNFLAGDVPAETWREDVEQIRKAAERAAALTRQLLAFSRRQAVQLRLVDLNAEFSELERMLRRTVGEDIHWEVSLTPGLGCIKADPGQVQQIFMNLIVNARDAMPSGGTLTVRTMRAPVLEPRTAEGAPIPPGDYVAFEVGDTGVGIDEEVKAHIFEPFFTTKPRGKGTGLGLAVIYGIVKQSGGHIAVESALGAGTTFKIYFPRVEGSAGAGSNAGETEAEGPRGGTETILLVDDDEAVRRIARRVLQSHGYSVLEAGNGEEAVRLAQSHRRALRLLLTDMVLPDFNGTELSRRIAALCPEAKVILVSGYLGGDFGNFVLEEHIPFLQKPFGPSALARLVREVLDAK